VPRTIALIVAAGLVAALLPACHNQTDKESVSDVVAAYLQSWSTRDYAAMGRAQIRATDVAALAAFNRAMVTDLRVKRAAFAAAKPVEEKTRATVRLTNRFTIEEFGTWTAHGVIRLVQRDEHWFIDWSPQEIDTELRTGERFVRTISWADRAPILGAGGVPLTSSATIVTIGLQGSRIKNAQQVSAALQAAGATAAQVARAIATATAHPTWFVSVFELPEATYLRFKPTIYPIPGTVFRTNGARAPITGDLAAHVVGRVGAITAEQLEHLGSPYRATDVVGQTGLEAAYERQLAGKPGGTIGVVDSTGKPVATLATFPTKRGAPVRTTIEPAMQRSAEHALDAAPGASAFVAIRASTGAVVASVARPREAGFDIALDGQYPPGSTFKIVTAANLLEHGLTPASVVSCPATITVDGRVFHNFEGEAAASLTLQHAFAESCNNAFIGSSARLPATTWSSTAKQFGLGSAPHLGIEAFGGRVPDPTTATERAATAIGQARIVVSPLAMACVAAAVDTGRFRAPTLVQGVSANASTPAIDPKVVAALRVMMGDVVASGTAAGRGLPPGTLGKTGTAEFGSANPPQTHAWFVGYRGDIAFAVLVVGGGVGGRVAAPLAATFLNSIAG
jgi:cell division protein FtsI/penicillin-binding protein 2